MARRRAPDRVVSACQSPHALERVRCQMPPSPASAKRSYRSPLCTIAGDPVTSCPSSRSHDVHGPVGGDVIWCNVPAPGRTTWKWPLAYSAHALGSDVIDGGVLVTSRHAHSGGFAP